MRVKRLQSNRSKTPCLVFLPGLATESAVVLLPDDLDGDPVHVGDPEGESHLSAGPSAEDPADGVPGGELLGEGLLRLLVADEHEDLLVGSSEADHSVVLQGPRGVLPNLVAVDPGTWEEKVNKTRKV